MLPPPPPTQFEYYAAGAWGGIFTSWPQDGWASYSASMLAGSFYHFVQTTTQTSATTATVTLYVNGVAEKTKMLSMAWPGDVDRTLNSLGRTVTSGRTTKVRPHSD